MNPVSRSRGFFNIFILNFLFRVPTVLLPLLVEKFPYVVLPGYMQQCYVRNLLQIAIYVAKLRPQILELIISNLTKLDVSFYNGQLMPVVINFHDKELMISTWNMDNIDALWLFIWIPMKT